ncbi:putative methyltransferase DDB_G0268948 [Ciona intestinalis]
MHRFFETSKVVAAYFRTRPKTPPEVAKKAIDFLGKRNAPDEHGKYGRVADVGCGSGQSTEMFAPYFHNVIGVDVSHNQIAMAREKNKTKNVSYMVGASEELPFEDESLDLVASGAAVHWFDFKKFANECNRVLKPNGSLFLHSYHSFPPHLGPVDTQRFTEKQLSRILESTQIRTREFKGLLPTHPRAKNVFEVFLQIYDIIQSAEKTFEPKVCKIVREQNLDNVAELLSTWTGYNEYLKRKSSNTNVQTTQGIVEDDILLQYVNDIKKLWGMKDLDNDVINVKVMLDVFAIASARPEPII